MVNALTTAILQNRERRAFREVIANLMVFDEKGVKIQFSKYIQTAKPHDIFLIFWNKEGVERYGHRFSLFTFKHWDETAGFLIGVLAESGKSGMDIGDHDDVNLTYIEKIQTGTPDRCFYFAKEICRENKSLLARLKRIEKKFSSFLE